MQQAITVKFLACTNNKPSRYKAICGGGSLTMSCDQAINKAGSSLLAPEYVAIELAKKLGWKVLDLSGNKTSNSEKHFKLKGGTDFQGNYQFVLC